MYKKRKNYTEIAVQPHKQYIKRSHLILRNKITDFFFSFSVLFCVTQKKFISELRIYKKDKRSGTLLRKWLEGKYIYYCVLSSFPVTQIQIYSFIVYCSTQREREMKKKRVTSSKRWTCEMMKKKVKQERYNV